MKTEKRLAPAPFNEVQGRTLSGYAILWGVESRIGDMVEVFERGAFTRTLADRTNLRDILLLVDHDPTQLLARQANASLKIEEDARGLRVQASLPDTQLGNDILTMAGSGLLGGFSIGFVALDDAWAGNRRSVKEAALVEISAIHSHAAYRETAATVSVRSLHAGAEADLRKRLYLHYIGA